MHREVLYYPLCIDIRPPPKTGRSSPSPIASTKPRAAAASSSEKQNRRSFVVCRNPQAADCKKKKALSHEDSAF